MKQGLSRRNFLKGSVVGATALAAGGLVGCNAQTAESSESYTYADTFAWNAEYDVVVVGFGGAGASAAVSAADAGAKVLLCDVAPEGHEGGNTRYCAQLICSTTNKSEMLEYLKNLAWKFDYDEDVLDVYAQGMADMKESLKLFDVDEVVEWPNGSTVIAPEYPEAVGGESVISLTLNPAAFDSALWQAMRAAVLKRSDSISVWLESPAQHLIQEPETGTIIGVEIEKAGEKTLVRAKNGVILTCGGFENNKEMAQDYLGSPRFNPYGTLYNRGDGHRMALEVGADLWHMECYESLGLYASYCWEVEEGERALLQRSGEDSPFPITSDGELFAHGSIICVGDDGSRFVREDETNRHGHVNYCGAYRIPQINNNPHAILDAPQLAELKEGGYILEDEEARMITASTIDELAEKINADKKILEQTIEDFNYFASTGRDYRCGRAPESMRAFDGRGYYAIPLRPAILNTQGGPRRNAQSQVIGANGEPIPHLYSAGEFGGVTIFQYNGGGNLAECIIFGKIAGEGAASEKEPLPELVQRKKEESDIKYGIGEGDYTINDEEAVSLADNEFVGTSSQGIGGDLQVKVTLEGDAISSVEILKENETPEIGGEALEQLIKEVTSSGSTDVDVVSGATVTSNAFLEAIDNALS